MQIEFKIKFLNTSELSAKSAKTFVHLNVPKLVRGCQLQHAEPARGLLASGISGMREGGVVQCTQSGLRPERAV